MRPKTAIGIFSIFCIAMLVFSGCGQSVPKDEELAAVSRQIANNYKTELMGELKAALDDTTISTAGAIYVCAERAPEISAARRFHRRKRPLLSATIGVP